MDIWEEEWKDESYRKVFTKIILIGKIEIKNDLNNDKRSCKSVPGHPFCNYCAHMLTLEVIIYVGSKFCVLSSSEIILVSQKRFEKNNYS